MRLFVRSHCCGINSKISYVVIYRFSVFANLDETHALSRSFLVSSKPRWKRRTAVHVYVALFHKLSVLESEQQSVFQTDHLF